VDLSKGHLIDLSHEIKEGVPTWSGDCGFQSSIDSDYSESGARVMSYRSVAGVGTHMDAPSHFISGGASISDIGVEQLVAPLCVIRVSSDDPDYPLSPGDIAAYEHEFGQVPEGGVVAADTGWSARWSDPARYRNVDAAGQKHFPGFHIEAAELLLERSVVGIGIDTLSPDGGVSCDFPVHHLMLGHEGYLLENLANLHLVPESGAWIISLPSKIHGGAEAPCRSIAWTA